MAVFLAVLVVPGQRQKVIEDGLFGGKGTP